jgi:heterodisulfide reductase subunit A-like polyferredoxin
MAAYGLDEIIYRHAQAEGVLFIRSADAEVTVRPPLVAARDLVTGEDVALTPDLLVVVEAENGDGAVRVPPGGFAVEKGSPSMGEASTVREGVTSPGREDDLLDGEAIIGARAAATRAMTIALSPPDRAPQAVIVDRDRCSACLTCARVCPFGAARPSEEGKASIDGALCQACGICVGACPGRALSLPNYCGVAGGGSMLMEDRQ